MNLERVLKFIFLELLLYNLICLDRGTAKWTEKRRVVFLRELGEVVVASFVELMSFIACELDNCVARKHLFVAKRAFATLRFSQLLKDGLTKSRSGFLQHTLACRLLIACNTCALASRLLSREFKIAVELHFLTTNRMVLEVVQVTQLVLNIVIVDHSRYHLSLNGFIDFFIFRTAAR